MVSKKKLYRLFRPCALCVILDGELLRGKDILSSAKAAIDGGADMIQLRDKRSPAREMITTAKALGALCRDHDIPFIVNDRIEAAVAADADGVHIGQGDIDPALARKLLGPGKLIGVSASTVVQAARAKRDGASYIGAGPVFKTPIKSADRAKGVMLVEKIMMLGIPFLAIGGINCSNVKRLTARGIRSIAVIRAVCSARDKSKAAQRLKKALAP